MLKISQAQMEAFEADFRLRRRVRFVSALRTCGWIDSALPDSIALKRVDAAVDDAKSVGIVEDEDVVRFAALAFIPERDRHKPRLASLFGHVLNDWAVDPRIRLDFVFAAGRLTQYGADPLPFSPFKSASS